MRQFTITYEDYIEAQHLFLGWKRWRLHILLFLTFLILTSKDIVSGNGKHPIASIAITSIVFFAFGLLAIILLKRKHRRIYDSHKSLQQVNMLSFTTEVLSWTTDSGANVINWDDVYKYKLNDKMIIILTAINLMHPIPLRAFETVEEKNRFLEILTNKIKRT